MQEERQVRRLRRALPAGCRRVAPPHWLAVLVSLPVAPFLGGVCAASPSPSATSPSRADVYADQVQNFLVHIVRWMDRQGIDRKWRKSQSSRRSPTTASTWVTATVFGLGEGLPASLTTALVILFTLYLLLTPSALDERAATATAAAARRRRRRRPRRSPRRARATAFSRRVDKQINAYIKGKIALAPRRPLTAASSALRVDLWLALSVASSPTSSQTSAPSSPSSMPVVLIDPEGSPSAPSRSSSSSCRRRRQRCRAHPLRPSEAPPVVVLLSPSIWGFLWGIPAASSRPPPPSREFRLASIDRPPRPRHGVIPTLLCLALRFLPDQDGSHTATGAPAPRRPPLAPTPHPPPRRLFPARPIGRSSSTTPTAESRPPGRGVISRPPAREVPFGQRSTSTMARPRVIDGA